MGGFQTVAGGGQGFLGNVAGIYEGIGKGSQQPLTL